MRADARGRDTDADRRGDGVAVDFGGMLREGAADALGNLDRLGLGPARQQDRELLAAEAAGEIACADAAVQGRGKDLQHPVADRVAEHVVDLLEVIEVGEQHGERLAAR